MPSINEIKQYLSLYFDEVPNVSDEMLFKVYDYYVKEGVISPIVEKVIREIAEPKPENQRTETQISLLDRFACAGFMSSKNVSFHGKDAEVVLSILMAKKPKLDWNKYGETWLVVLPTKESKELQWYKHIIRKGAGTEPDLVEVRYRKRDSKTGEPVPSKLTVANERGSDNHDMQSQATFGFKASVKFAVLEWDYRKFKVIKINQELPYYLDNWQSGKVVFEYQPYNKVAPFYKWWKDTHSESFNKYWNANNRYWLRVINNDATNVHHEKAHKRYVLRMQIEDVYKRHLLKPIIANSVISREERLDPHDYQSPYANGKIKKAKSKMSSGGKNPNSFSSTSSSLAKHRLSEAVSTQSRFYKDGKRQYKLELRYSKKVYQVWTDGSERLLAVIQSDLRPKFVIDINKSNQELKERVDRFLVVDKPVDKRTTKESERIIAIGIKPDSIAGEAEKERLHKLQRQNERMRRKEQRRKAAIERELAESGKKQFRLV